MTFDAYITQWQKEITSKRKVTIQSAPLAEIDPSAPLTPLHVRLKKFIESLPEELRSQPQSLEFFRQGLRGRQGGKAHAGELGDALRKMDYSRKRAWNSKEANFRALWHPPK